MMSFLPTVEEICSAVSEEIAILGGEITERFESEERIVLRAILPRDNVVQPGDVVQAGVALMAVDDEIQVRPYILRHSCRTGIILPELASKHCIDRVDSVVPLDLVDMTVEDLREAVRACATNEVFCAGVAQMMSALATHADLNIFRILHLVSWVPGRAASELRRAIADRFMDSRDRSVFDLLCAVTSVARDQEDPAVRWRLEELGGGVLAQNLPNPCPERSMYQPFVDRIADRDDAAVYS